VQAAGLHAVASFGPWLYLGEPVVNLSLIQKMQEVLVPQRFPAFVRAASYWSANSSGAAKTDLRTENFWCWTFGIISE
jgi:hypothetical protein